jgi:sugar transferase (PEP-CTERM/EpsH1 system associated)
MRRRLAPLVSQFVAVSYDLERWLREDVRVPARKICTIHNGVDVGRFTRSTRMEAREFFGLPMDAPVICTVGRLDPVKDHVGLVRAFASVLPTHPEALLLIAGDGPCREDLMQLIGELGVAGQVRLLGERRDVPRVLAATDLFVLPSIAEGMSNTVLEAMAAGLPVVATKVGGNPELVADGLTGRLVPSRSPVALGEALRTYLDDPRLRALHGKASRERAALSFGLDRMCEKYVNLYRRLLRARGEEGY